MIPGETAGQRRTENRFQLRRLHGKHEYLLTFILAKKSHATKSQRLYDMTEKEARSGVVFVWRERKRSGREMYDSINDVPEWSGIHSSDNCNYPLRTTFTVRVYFP